jgi:hypothetical protein
LAIRDDFKTRSFGKLHQQSVNKAENRRVTIFYLLEKAFIFFESDFVSDLYFSHIDLYFSVKFLFINFLSSLHKSFYTNINQKL